MTDNQKNTVLDLCYLQDSGGYFLPFDTQNYSETCDAFLEKYKKECVLDLSNPTETDWDVYHFFRLCKEAEEKRQQALSLLKKLEGGALCKKEGE